MDAPQTQIVPRKRSFWKMVKTVFLPAQGVVRLMTGCGGGKGRKLKRRLTIRNMQEAKDAFLQSTIQRPPPPTEVNNNSRHSRLQSQNSEPTGSPPPLPSIPPPPRPDNTDIFAYDEVNIYRPLAPRPLTTAEYYSPEEVASITNVHASRSSASPSSPSVSTSALPAPLNLEEAQILLESLAMNSINSAPPENYNEVDGRNRHVGNWVEQLVDVVIEPGPSTPDHVQDDGRRDPISYLSSRSRSSTIGDGDGVEDDYDDDGGDTNSNTNENIIEGSNFTRNKTRIELSSKSTSRLETISYQNNAANRSASVSMPRSRTSASLSFSSQPGDEFHGWRKSSIEVSSNPPVTLAFIPSGLCVGDRVVWVQDDRPEIGTTRWIGKIRNQFYAGVEFDKPVGNSSGIYGYGVGMHKRLFTCQLPYGRFIPVKELVLYKDYHDTGVKSGIVCIICRDDFLETWEPDLCLRTTDTAGNDVQAPNMISTKCGHLYHLGCLDHWFSTKKRADYHCPFCLKPMARDEVIRIFPSQI